jgi:hypothetical protein
MHLGYGQVMFDGWASTSLHYTAFGGFRQAGAARAPRLFAKPVLLPGIAERRPGVALYTQPAEPPGMAKLRLDEYPLLH